MARVDITDALVDIVGVTDRQIVIKIGETVVLVRDVEVRSIPLRVRYSRHGSTG